MTPDEIVHFAERIALIGAYEGLLYQHGDSQPDGMYVRLDDGTPAAVFAMCVDGPADEHYLTWTDGGYSYGGRTAIDALHDHSDDTLRWRDESGFHVESCALARV